MHDQLRAQASSTSAQTVRTRPLFTPANLTLLLLANKIIPKSPFSIPERFLRDGLAKSFSPAVT
jgi:hypothetical protein